MARRRSKRQRRASEAPIVRPLAVRLLRPLAPPSLPRHPRSEIEDRRTHHPLGFFRPARQWSGHGVKPHVVSPAKKFSPALPFNVRFADPRKTLVCVRRKERREVIFAKNKMKRGAAARRRRRNWFSEVSC